MSPKTRAHENAVTWLNRWLLLAVDAGRFEVRVGSPLTVGSSEPEPDLAVIARDAPRPNHPATATLVIEVAVSSLERDLDVKPGVYAGALVAEYWVVDLAGRRCVVHRHPRDGGYGEHVSFGPADTLTSVALELPPLPLSAVFAAADA